ncbi:hypothetical protein BN946_scf184872.g6 [Trametes cinnabarina]|uniref:Uncharacterized protein n=1 Tax=Pycnoporus cinnabarinus TaxID=5643 RepID=A0A060S7M8_PYCCI|nr:hypothetical protein BN946_scf184872.g6 [Trametes cinnabarina]
MASLGFASLISPSKVPEDTVSPARDQPASDHSQFSFSYYLANDDTMADLELFESGTAYTPQPDDMPSQSTAFGFILPAYMPTYPTPPSVIDAATLGRRLPSNMQRLPSPTPRCICPQELSLHPAPHSHIAASPSSSSPPSSPSMSSLYLSPTTSASSPSEQATSAAALSPANAVQPLPRGSPTLHHGLAAPSDATPTYMAPSAQQTQQSVRRSTRKRSSPQVTRENAGRPLRSKKGKTAARAVAVPTQPVASGSAAAPTEPAKSAETLARRRARKRPREVVDAFMIPGEPCACPLEGCNGEFGNSRDDNIEHLRMHYTADGLKRGRMDCPWPGCKGKNIPRNTFIDHIAMRHVGIKYHCPLRDTPGVECVWVTHKSGYTDQHMVNFHGYPPRRTSEPDVPCAKRRKHQA